MIRIDRFTRKFESIIDPVQVFPILPCPIQVDQKGMMRQSTGQQRNFPEKRSGAV